MLQTLSFRSGLKGDHLGDGMSSEDSSDSKEKEPSGDPSNHGMDIYEGSLALQVGLCHCLRTRNLMFDYNTFEQLDCGVSLRTLG